MSTTAEAHLEGGWTSRKIGKGLYRATHPDHPGVAYYAHQIAGRSRWRLSRHDKDDPPNSLGRLLDYGFTKQEMLAGLDGWEAEVRKEKALQEVQVRKEKALHDRALVALTGQPVDMAEYVTSPTSFRLSARDKKRIEELARLGRCSATEALRRLIREAHDRLCLS